MQSRSKCTTKKWKSKCLRGPKKKKKTRNNKLNRLGPSPWKSRVRRPFSPKAKNNSLHQNRRFGRYRRWERRYINSRLKAWHWDSTLSRSSSAFRKKLKWRMKTKSRKRHKKGKTLWKVTFTRWETNWTLIISSMFCLKQISSSNLS